MKLSASNSSKVFSTCFAKPSSISLETAAETSPSSRSRSSNANSNSLLLDSNISGNLLVMSIVQTRSVSIWRYLFLSSSDNDCNLSFQKISSSSTFSPGAFELDSPPLSESRFSYVNLSTSSSSSSLLSSNAEPSPSLDPSSEPPSSLSSFFFFFVSFPASSSSSSSSSSSDSS